MQLSSYMEVVCHGGITKKLLKCYKQIIHIIIPILDGHAGSDKRFTTIENNALEVIRIYKMINWMVPFY